VHEDQRHAPRARLRSAALRQLATIARADREAGERPTDVEQRRP
jgi:hypothetical protein